MDSLKLREDLLKSMYSYFDIKENVKYLLYFTQTTSTDTTTSSCDLRFQLTNGINVWCVNVTNDSFINEQILQTRSSSSSKQHTATSSISSLNEFLFNLNKCLKKDEYELSKLVDTETLNDLIEIELKSQHEIKFRLTQVKSNENELKDLLFNMFTKMNRLEHELSKLQSTHNISSSSNTNSGGLMNNNNNNDKLNQQNNSNNNPQVKRFSLTKQQVANVISSQQRKPYMSIINPMNKRRKTPKGVQFDEEDTNSSESDSENTTDNKVKS